MRRFTKIRVIQPKRHLTFITARSSNICQQVSHIASIFQSNYSTYNHFTISIFYIL